MLVRIAFCMFLVTVGTCALALSVRSTVTLTSSPSLETPIFISLTSGTRPIACRAICESAVRDMCTCAPSSELTVMNDAGTRFLFLPKIIITI